MSARALDLKLVLTPVRHCPALFTAGAAGVGSIVVSQPDGDDRFLVAVRHADGTMLVAELTDVDLEAFADQLADALRGSTDRLADGVAGNDR